MTKTINIFLSSSVYDFKNEIKEIEYFVYTLNENFKKNYDCTLELLSYKDFDPAMSKVDMQDKLNDLIRQSDICIFMFNKKVGIFTEEEFDVAYKTFKQNQKPIIYPYFKVINTDEAEQSFLDFKAKISNEYGLYPIDFEYIDTIKLRLLQTIAETKLKGIVDIKLEGDKILVDGKEILSTENIAEFANNVLFKKLSANLEVVKSEFYKLKVKYKKGECSDREYFNVIKEKEQLDTQIEELRKTIFNMSLRMCRDEARGEITQLQREAYKLFEAGNLEEANKILNSEDMTKAYLQTKTNREEQKIKTRAYIGELRTKIEILTAMVYNDNRFNEIEDIYNQITKVALEQQVELDIVYDFAYFLYWQNNHPKAYKIAKQLEALISPDNQEETADLYHLLATISDEFPTQKDESIEYYNKAIALREKLAKTNPDRFEPDLATSYNNAGLFYDNQGNTQKAEEFYNKAIAIREKLAKTNPDRFEPDLAGSYNNAGAFYDDQGQQQKAEEFYNKAIAIREKLAKTNPDRFEPDLANSYNNAGLFYADQGQPQKAEAFYNKAIAIREKLAKTNPDRFEPNLATSYNNAGVFYDNQGNTQKAEEFYNKAIAIREKLAKTNPDRFEPDLAMSYNNAGIFYKNQGQPQKAEKLYNKAIAIRERLAKSNPERFEPDLADSYNNAGVFFRNQGNPQKAEDFYNKAIAIRERLAKSNPDRFEPDLAISYNNVGVFYDTHGMSINAEEYYIKSIKIREKLAISNPDRFEPDLAISYYNYAIFTKNDRFLKKAYNITKKHPHHPYCRQITESLSKYF